MLLGRGSVGDARKQRIDLSVRHADRQQKLPRVDAKICRFGSETLMFSAFKRKAQYKRNGKHSIEMVCMHNLVL